MSRSATCSDRRRGPALPARAASVAGALAVALAAALAPAHATVLLTREKALRQAFGEDAEVSRSTAFLTEDQLRRARERAGPGVRVESALVPRYVARRDGKLLGTAYLDTHRVRTLEESVMIVVAPDGSVGRVDILTFAEPDDYIPRPGWLEQFVGRVLGDDLAIKKGIHGITGATLSAAAATDAVRRVLAIHEVLSEETGR